MKIYLTLSVIILTLIIAIFKYREYKKYIEFNRAYSSFKVTFEDGIIFSGIMQIFTIWFIYGFMYLLNN